MAQALYDTSPSRSFQRYSTSVEISSQVADTMNAVPAKRSQVNYNMSHRSAPKKRLSRLELLRNDFNKKLQIERDEKINKLRMIQQENSMKQNPSDRRGIVREFFTERHALEATQSGQKNPELLPPIDSHFKRVKAQKQNLSLQGQLQSEQRSAGKRTVLMQEPQIPQKPLPVKHTVRTKPQQTGVHVRKRTKGIDKQDPLPPVNKGGSDVKRRKPPTPNKRYETHSFLMQDNVEDLEYSGPSMPMPPIQRKAITKQSKAPLPPPSGEESVSDLEDAQSTLTDHSSAPPNLSRLKAKALKQKQLSKQRLNILTQQKDDTKLTDFQKWQMDQDKEREQRLVRHKQQTEKSKVSLSQRERDLLQKIQEEQLRLESLQQQRKELEEQEHRQNEEDKKWLVEKHSLEESLLPPEPTKDLTQTKKTVSKRAAKAHVQKPAREETPPTQKQEDPSESESVHGNANSNFYAEQIEGMSEVVVDISPCSICGRKFASDRLARHEKVCTKTANSKRKVFDTRMHRSKGTDHEKYIQSGKYLEEPKKRVSLGFVLCEFVNPQRKAHCR